MITSQLMQRNLDELLTSKIKKVLVHTLCFTYLLGSCCQAAVSTFCFCWKERWAICWLLSSLFFGCPLSEFEAHLHHPTYQDIPACRSHSAHSYLCLQLKKPVWDSFFQTYEWKWYLQFVVAENEELNIYAHDIPSSKLISLSYC